MSRKVVDGTVDFESKATFELACHFVECSRAFERTANASWFTNPLLRWSRKAEMMKLQHAINGVSGELAVRYKGIMYQVFQRMGASREFGEAIVEAWISVRQTASRMDDNRNFFSALWRAFAFRTTSVQLLKPKFMLRAFVDELEPGKEQGILLATAYDDSAATVPTGAEMLRSLERAYELLHGQLKRRLPELALLTDHAISAVIIGELSPPFVVYEVWIYYS